LGESVHFAHPFRFRVVGVFRGSNCFFQDKEDVASERAFNWCVSTVNAVRTSAFRESGYHPCDPRHPWFLNYRVQD
jgi:hypothetical protein